MVGELSAIDGGPRSANASALVDGELFVIPAARFRSLLEVHSSITVQLLLVLAGRLRWASQRQLEFSAGDARRTCAGPSSSSPTATASNVSVPARSCSLWARETWPPGAGCRCEAVVKGLKALRQLGWVQGEGRRLRLVDEASLRARARA